MATLPSCRRCSAPRPLCTRRSRLITAKTEGGVTTISQKLVEGLAHHEVKINKTLDILPLRTFHYHWQLRAAARGKKGKTQEETAATNQKSPNQSTSSAHATHVQENEGPVFGAPGRRSQLCASPRLARSPVRYLASSFSKSTTSASLTLVFCATPPIANSLRHPEHVHALAQMLKGSAVELPPLSAEQVAAGNWPPVVPAPRKWLVRVRIKRLRAEPSDDHFMSFC